MTQKVLRAELAGDQPVASPMHDHGGVEAAHEQRPAMAEVHKLHPHMSMRLPSPAKAKMWPLYTGMSLLLAAVVVLGAMVVSEESQPVAPQAVPGYAQDIIRDLLAVNARLREVEMSTSDVQLSVDMLRMKTEKDIEQLGTQVLAVAEIADETRAYATGLDRGISDIRMEMLGLKDSQQKMQQPVAKPAPKEVKKVAKAVSAPVATKPVPVPVKPSKALAPWDIMALTDSSAFVRDQKTGRQQLLRVGHETGACGRLLEIDLSGMRILTSNCSPLVKG